MSTIRERKHRLPRSAYLGHEMVSLTACTERREVLFEEAQVVDAFVEILGEVSRRHQCTVPVFCFMPDHLHLILQGETPEADIWAAMAEFKQRSGFWLHKNRRGIAWQKSFHDHIIRREEDMATHARYILENPCRKGITARWQDYPFKGSIGHTIEQVLMGLPFV